MKLQIATVKKEIRILGLDTCSAERMVGAVLRGGLYLDGVIIVQADVRVSKAIVDSKYYPEIRAIMLHDPQGKLKPEDVESETRLPVIGVSTSDPKHSGYEKFQVRGRTLWLKTHLATSTVEKILRLTLSAWKLPEPVRIAHLLSRTRYPKHPLPRGKH